jgi:5-(carboxyamino)imidazole ribonucleotide mutase
MSKPLVSIIMGSSNDWEIMSQAAQQLKDFGVAYDARVISAHRSPDLLFDYIKEVSADGVQCFIAGAGGAAHLAGVIAGKTTLPVLGVPIPSKYLRGEDSLLSIVQMPRGVPVATFAIGEAGAANAALYAIAMLATEDAALAMKLAQYRATQTEKARNMTLPL